MCPPAHPAQPPAPLHQILETSFKTQLDTLLPGLEAAALRRLAVTVAAARNESGVEVLVDAAQHAHQHQYQYQEMTAAACAGGDNAGGAGETGDCAKGEASEGRSVPFIGDDVEALSLATDLRRAVEECLDHPASAGGRAVEGSDAAEGEVEDDDDDDVAPSSLMALSDMLDELDIKTGQAEGAGARPVMPSLRLLAHRCWLPRVHADTNIGSAGTDGGGDGGGNAWRQKLGAAAAAYMSKVAADAVVMNIDRRSLEEASGLEGMDAVALRALVRNVSMAHPWPPSAFGVPASDEEEAQHGSRQIAGLRVASAFLDAVLSEGQARRDLFTVLAKGKEAAIDAVADALPGIVRAAYHFESRLGYCRRHAVEVAVALVGAKKAEVAEAEVLRDRLAKDEGKDFGVENSFHAVDDMCFELVKKPYTYKVCPYGEATQDSTSLGKFKAWSGYMPGGAGGDDWTRILCPDSKHCTMDFEDGTKCFNGPRRKTHVHVVCGSTDALVHVEETEQCVYHATLETPSACTRTQLEALVTVGRQEGLVASGGGVTVA